MQLKEQIKNYYFEHLHELSEDKRFHFSSRLHAWEDDTQAKAELLKLKGYMIGDGRASKTLAGIMERPIGRLYAKQLRQPYFDKYPSLFGIHNALFRIRHLKEIYSIDWRGEFLKITDETKLEQLYTDLVKDKAALRVLSRFAIDYLYLYEILFEKARRFTPDEIKELSSAYDLRDNSQVHLLIYLFTHAIIADSNFYTRPLPDSRLETYRGMLSVLDSLLESRGGHIKLDAKFEFLVACRICGQGSRFFEIFEHEARQSLSKKGLFIFDPLVGGPDAGLNGFERSEHRNVLYIMGGSPYRYATRTSA
jgi:hypothetical protein